MFKKSVKRASIVLGILIVTTSCSKNDENIVPVTPPSLKETVFFSETFEKYPLTTFKNGDKTPIKKGKSTCSKVGVGTALEHKSAKVDYKTKQNLGSFLALNPESVCGVANKAKIIYNTDIPIQRRPIYLRFKYYQTSTLGLGKASIKVIVKDEKDKWVIESLINKKDDWTEYHVAVPASIKNKITSIEIEMGSGEAFGIDDFVMYYL